MKPLLKALKSVEGKFESFNKPVQSILTAVAVVSLAVPMFFYGSHAVDETTKQVLLGNVRAQSDDAVDFVMAMSGGCRVDGDVRLASFLPAVWSEARGMKRGPGVKEIALHGEYNFSLTLDQEIVERFPDLQRDMSFDVRELRKQLICPRWRR